MKDRRKDAVIFRKLNNMHALRRLNIASLVREHEQLALTRTNFFHVAFEFFQQHKEEF